MFERGPEKNDFFESLFCLECFESTQERSAVEKFGSDCITFTLVFATNYTSNSPICLRITNNISFSLKIYL